MINLSICIPTYNRAEFLRVNLETILRVILWSGYYDKIEICISDNNSTDNTFEIVNEFISQYPKVRFNFHQNKKNIGPDLNYLKVISLASCEYCWFLGSDDIIVDEAFQIIFSHLEKGEYDLYIFNRIDFEYSIDNIRRKFWLNENIDQFVVNKKNLSKYLDYSNNIGSVFSYISSIIFKRDRWNSIDFDYSYIGTAYSHVYILMNLLIQGSEMIYSRESIVYNRMGNDHFSEGGYYNRVILDLRGYKKLICDLDFSDEDKVALKNLLKRERPFYQLIKKYNKKAQQQELIEMVEFYKYNIFYKYYLIFFSVSFNMRIVDFLVWMKTRM